MAGFGSFADRVLEHAAERGEADAFRFLTDGVRGVEPERLSYKRLDTTAKSIAASLQDRGLSGRQILLLYPSGPDFIVAFLACLYAGSVAVPAPLPSEQGHKFRRVSGIVKDADVGAVLTIAEHAPAVQEWLTEEGFSDVACMATDQGLTHDPDSWKQPDLGPDDLAFLQYTSGSTSAPKGVMVSHGNLLANQLAIFHALGTRTDTVVGGWLPMFHDMGLIGGILHPLWLGCTSILISPTSFLRRPVRWLEVISEHRVTVSPAPNFAYELCVRRIKEEHLEGIDLSSWTVALNGSEPVRPETMRAFAKRFAPYGLRPGALYPAYGMAETTLLVSGTPRMRGALLRDVDATGLEQGRLEGPYLGRPTRALASSGVVHAGDFEVRIVDPETLAEQPPAHVGEIWVRGGSVSTGYWQRPEVNKEIFGARIAGAEDLGTWLRTGDLGAMEQGELYVTGRLKEMVLINGRNVYPHDVEGVVTELSPALRMGAVFSVDSGQEHLVIIQEVRERDLEGDLKGLAASIQQTVSREFAVPAGNVVLVRPGTVRRTTSGKIQRTLMRKLFLEGAVTSAALLTVLEPPVRALLPETAPSDGSEA